MPRGAPVEPGLLRPDLSIPLPPLRAVPAATRCVLTVLREPAFARAQLRTPWLAVAAVLLVVLGQFAVVGSIREPVVACGAVLAAYTAVRATALTIFERRQHAFEPEWLADRSAALRAGRFEVVRFVLDGRAYDLTDPEAVPGIPARARFPDARYALQPSGRQTYWLLGEPVMLTVAAPAGRAARRAEIGSTDRSGVARRAGARHPERT